MVLLNVDAGERPDEPEDLWAACDVLCVACGGHAGDEASMTRVVTFCASRERPRLGAHPSYPDREGFGRRTIAIEPASLFAAICNQLSALVRIAHAHGVAVEHVKPHGALYHDAAASPELAALVVAAVVAVLGQAAIVIGPPAGALRAAATERGLRYLREGFADRRTGPDGTLVPRSEPGALITDPAACAARAHELADHVDTICVHGDTPNAVDIVSAVRTVLAAS